MDPLPQSPAARPGFRATLARTSSAQKSQRGAPGYSRWVNRRAGRVLASLAHMIGATPNQVTALSCVFTYAAILVVAIVTPGWAVDVGVAVALLLGYALDSADGQLARLRGGGSAVGEWLDHVTDAVKGTGIHLAVLVCWFRFFDVPHAALLLIPVGYTLVASVFFFSVILTDLVRRSSAAGRPAGTPARPDPATSATAPALRSILVLPADYGVLCLTFVLLPVPQVFGTVYAVLLAFAVFFLLGAWRNWYRELSALGR